MLDLQPQEEYERKINKEQAQSNTLDEKWERNEFSHFFLQAGLDSEYYEQVIQEVFEREESDKNTLSKQEFLQMTKNIRSELKGKIKEMRNEFKSLSEQLSTHLKDSNLNQ